MRRTAARSSGRRKAPYTELGSEKARGRGPSVFLRKVRHGSDFPDVLLDGRGARVSLRGLFDDPFAERLATESGFEWLESMATMNGENAFTPLSLGRARASAEVPHGHACALRFA